MSEIRANSITDAAGTGAPNFPNGLEIAGGTTLSAIATQAQAEAGTDNTTLMTPLRAAQAIGALAPAPALDYELISTSTISSAVATVDFTGFDNSVYGSYAFTLHSVIPVTDNVDFLMRYSVDGGSTFISTNTYDYHLSSQLGGTVTNEGLDLFNTIYLTSSNVGSAAGETGVSGEVRLFTPDGSRKTYTRAWIGYDNVSGFLAGVDSSGRNSTTSAVNAVRFYFSSGDVESGRISMYGIRRV
jgi:hypothetical protein